MAYIGEKFGVYKVQSRLARRSDPSIIINNMAIKSIN